MSNKELYQRSFDKLHPSKEFEKELQTMMDHQEQKSHKLRGRKMIALAAAVVIVLSLAVAASASGFVQTVRMWINGQEVDAQEYMDADGNLVYEAEAGPGEMHVFMSEGFDSAEATDADMQMAYDFIRVEYAYENGRDLLRFTQTSTGLTEEVDITEQMQDGCFDGTLSLEKFNAAAQVSLNTNGDLSYSIETDAE